MKPFEFMLEHQHCFALSRMTSVFEASRSGYYQWRKTGAVTRSQEQKRNTRDQMIIEAFDESKGRYGARRIQHELAEQGASANIKTISQSMKRQNLVAKAARKFKVTPNSAHQLPVAPNLLEQDFKASSPNQKWVNDITYLMTREGWLYLAVVLDLYSRAIVGWSMSTRMTADLACDALTMAFYKRHFPKDVIIHSDRGSQYCSHAYRKLAKKHELRLSMSKTACCWDNACAESFFHSLKVEAINDEPIMDRETMRQMVFEYIEVGYNRKRRHSANGYVSPANYELKNVA